MVFLLRLLRVGETRLEGCTRRCRSTGREVPDRQMDRETDTNEIERTED